MKLIRPFKDASGTVRTELHPRDYMTGGDVLAMNRASMTDPALRSFVLVARFCGLDLSEVESMDVKDIDAVSAHIEVVTAPKAPEGTTP